MKTVAISSVYELSVRQIQWHIAIPHWSHHPADKKHLSFSVWRKFQGWQNWTHSHNQEARIPLESSETGRNHT